MTGCLSPVVHGSIPAKVFERGESPTELVYAGMFRKSPRSERTAPDFDSLPAGKRTKQRILIESAGSTPDVRSAELA